MNCSQVHARKKMIVTFTENVTLAYFLEKSSDEVFNYMVNLISAKINGLLRRKSVGYKQKKTTIQRIDERGHH